jgi:hypothetical protein
MSEHRPTFVVRRNPEFGWVINVLWPDREAEVIKRFWLGNISRAGTSGNRFGFLIMRP